MSGGVCPCSPPQTLSKTVTAGLGEGPPHGGRRGAGGPHSPALGPVEGPSHSSRQMGPQALRRGRDSRAAAHSHVSELNAPR